MDSVEQDVQEEDYVDEENSENQTNKPKPVSLFDALSVRINKLFKMSDYLFIGNFPSRRAHPIKIIHTWIH